MFLQGFVAFCLREVHFCIHRTAYALTCGGRLCGGQYGTTGRCPCTQVSHLPRHSLAVLMSVNDEDVYARNAQGLEFEEFISMELTEMLVGCDVLEVWSKIFKYKPINYFVI